jgi:TPR repeat protein
MLKHEILNFLSNCEHRRFWAGVPFKTLKITLILALGVNLGCGRGKSENSGESKGEAEKGIVSNATSSFEMFLNQLPSAEEQEQKSRDWNREALALYTRMADEGNPVAQYHLGTLYAVQMSKCYRGSMADYRQRRKPDFPRAIKWLSMAAEQGMPEAKRKLGLLYLGEKGGMTDPLKAREYLICGAEAGDTEAQFQLGLFYEAGKGGVTNFAEAIKWFQKWTYSRPAFVTGPDNYLLGFQLDGTDVVRVANVSDSNMLVLAKNGDEKAQYHWAQRLAYTAGDARSAKEWFSKSANNGYAPAQYELAAIYAEHVEKARNDKSEDEKLQASLEESKSQKGKQGESGSLNLDTAKSDAIKWYLKAAEQGWVRAQVALGRAYKWGDFSTSDPVQAVKWYEIAAKNGHGRAQLELAEMFYGGVWVEKDDNKALMWFRAAADQGINDAQYKIGLMCEYGEGTAVDCHEARKWYRQAAIRFHSAASVALARMLYRGKGGSRDIPAARQWFLLSASDSFQYSVVSMYLDLMRLNDEGVTTGDIEITKMMGEFAKKDRIDALYDLGRDFLTGTESLQAGTESQHRDTAEGILWLKQAAEIGSVKAQKLLGDIYSAGKLVSTDEVQAAQWYRKAAEQGDSSAQYTMGLYCVTGKGGELLPSEGVKWYRKAADQGDSMAQFDLGFLYASGQGVAQNYSEAVKWFRQSANQGVAAAQFNLGVCYVKGQGVVKDCKAAYGWLLLASAGGESKAYKAISKLEEMLSTDEQGAARTWAQNWRPNQEQFKDLGKGKSGSGAKGESPKWTSSGSGFFISENGYFITANHVIAGASKIVLNTATGTLDATLIASDPANDVAILKVNDSKSRTFSALVIPPRPKVTLGQTVFTVGFPNPTLQGINPKLTKGEISAMTGIQDDVRAYQVSLPVQPGNSGGVLADEHANVIGIVVQKLNTLGVALVTGDVPQNVNYALKVSYANSLIDSIPGLADSLPQTSGALLSFERAVEKVQAASALVLSFGQRNE